MSDKTGGSSAGLRSLQHRIGRVFGLSEDACTPKQAEPVGNLRGATRSRSAAPSTDYRMIRITS